MRTGSVRAISDSRDHMDGSRREESRRAVSENHETACSIRHGHGDTTARRASSDVPDRRRTPTVRSGDLEATRSESGKSGPEGPWGRCPLSLAGKINEG